MLELALLVLLFVALAACRHRPPRSPIVSTPAPTAAPVPPPAATPRPERYVGYFFASSTPYGDHSAKAPWASIHYAWAGRAYAASADEIPDVAVWLGRMALDVDGAIARGQSVHVALGGERGLDPTPLLDMLADGGRWNHVRYVDLADEPDWSPEELDSRAVWVRTLIAQRGLTSRPIGVILTQAQTLRGRPGLKGAFPLARGHEGDLGPAPSGGSHPPAAITSSRPSLGAAALVSVPSIDYVVVEAYFGPGDDGPAKVREFLRAAYAAIPTGKGIHVVGQAYTRNGAIGDPQLVVDAWGATVDAFLEDPRTQVLLWFSLGRPTGLLDLEAALGPGVLNLQRDLASRVSR